MKNSQEYNEWIDEMDSHMKEELTEEEYQRLRSEIPRPNSTYDWEREEHEKRIKWEEEWTRYDKELLSYFNSIQPSICARASAVVR